MSTRAWWLSALVGMALVLSACVDPPTVREWQVTTFVDGADAAPGDGVCEMTPSLGDCSLRAAVEEAAAITDGARAHVALPSGLYDLGSEGLLLDGGGGWLTIEAPQPGAVVRGPTAGPVLRAAAGEHVLLGLGVEGGSEGVRLDAGASVTLGAASVTGAAGDGVVVASGADLTVLNGTIDGNGGRGVAADGAASLTFATVSGNGAGGLGGSGSVALASSIVAEQAGGADCAVAVSSSGYNLDGDGSCGLGAASDLSAAAAELGPLGGGALRHRWPGPASAALDSIPSGVGGCTAGALDQDGRERPIGPACDRGAIEVDATLDLVVTAAADTRDAVPGDRRCADASGACTLRAAIDEVDAAPASAASGTHRITLASDVTLSRAGAGDDANATGDLDVAGEVVIVGGGHQIDGGLLDRVIDVAAGADVELVDVVVRRGSVSSDGGAIRNGGSLALDRSSVLASVASGAGGGVSSSGSLAVSSSTIADVDAARGAGVAVSGGVATLRSVTVSGDATVAGGGDAVAQTGGSVTVVASVLDDEGGAVCSGAVGSGGYNVVADGSCGFGATGDVTVPDTGLAPVTGASGLTPARYPVAGSAALDHIPVGVVGLCDGGQVDQHGEPRPAGASCDSGAVEASSSAVVVTVATDGVDAVPGDGICQDAGQPAGSCSLRSALVETDAAPGPGLVVVPSAIGPTISLTRTGTENAGVSGDLDVHGEVVLVADGTTLRVDGVEGGIEVHGGADVAIHGLGVQSAVVANPANLVYNAVSNPRLGIINRGDLVLDGVRLIGLVNNQGALVQAAGSLEVRRSFLALNHNARAVGSALGGGLSVYGGVAVVEDSAIVGNAGYGGGVAVTAGDLHLRRSTVTANATYTDLVIGVGFWTTFGERQHGGGGLTVRGGRVTVEASTISRNTGLMHELDPDPTPAVDVLVTTSLEVGGSIVGTCAGADLHSTGYNVLESASCAAAAVGTDRVGDARLAPVGSNGGPTSTTLPGAGSPAIDAIPPGTPGLCPVAGAADQRGAPRPSGPACDIGAAEGVGPAVAPTAPLELVVDVATDSVDATPADGVCADSTGHCSLRAALDTAEAASPGQVVVRIADGVDPTIGSTGGWRAHVRIEGGGATITTTRPLQFGGVVEVVDATITPAPGSGPVIRLFGGSARIRSSLLDLAGGTGLSASYGQIDIVRSVVRRGQAPDTTPVGVVLDAESTDARFDTSVITGTRWGRSTGPIVRANLGSVGVRSSTIARNGASRGPAIAVSSSSLSITGSVIDHDGPMCVGVTGASGGHNVLSDATCGTSPTDQVSVDPDHVLVGGDLAVAAGSPVLDVIPAGTPGLCEAASRDIDGAPRGAGGGCDVGAIEGATAPAVTGPSAWVVDAATDGPDAAPGDGVCAAAGGGCTLRAALDEANWATTADTVTIGAGVRPVLTAVGADDTNVVGDLDVLAPVTIDGGGGVIDGGGVDRVFDVAVPATLRRVTLTGGSTAGSGGGIAVTGAAVDLSAVTVAGNTAASGSAMAVVGGDVGLTYTTLWGNSGGETLAATSSTVTSSASLVEGPGADCTSVESALGSTGWSHDGDGTCGFTGPTDSHGPVGATFDGEVVVPFEFEPTVDAIPVGTPTLCDGTAPVDQRGTPRPGGPGCDIGAVEEYTAALALTVGAAADTVDAVPGDGTCADVGGQCSLRAAVMEVNATSAGAARITIAPGVNPQITRSGAGDDAAVTGDLDVLSSVTIDGAGATVTTISAGGLDRVFDVRSDDVVIRDVRLTGGVATSGGALSVTAGSVLVDDAVIEGNTGTSGAGGISLVSGDVTVTDSTVRANAGSTVGGLEVSSGNVVVDRSTFSANASTGGLGALAEGIGRAGSTGTLEVRNSTIEGTGTLVAWWGGVSIRNSTLWTATGPALLQSGATLTATAIVGSKACLQPVTSGGYNVVPDTTCFPAGGTDLVGVAPLLAPLGANGGPTTTMLPAANSLTTDRIPAGSAQCPVGSTDQRGVARPAGAACDVGAVEGTGPAVAPSIFTVTSGTDAVDAAPGDGVCASAAAGCTLRAAVMEANAFATADTIVIGAGVSPALSRAGRNENRAVTGDLDVLAPLTVQGGGAVVDAAGIDRVFDGYAPLVIEHVALVDGDARTFLGSPGGAVAARQPLTLRHVDISGSVGVGGGGVYATADLVVEDSTIHGNDALPAYSGRGGGILADGTLSVTRSQVTANTAAAGGGIDGRYGAVTLTDSTVSDNTATGEGGGISGTVTLTGSTVSGNTATGSGGGISGGTVTLTGSTVSGNTVTGNGGGISGSVTLTGSTVSGNTATGSGGGISGTATLTGSVITGNQAGQRGGGIAGSGTITDSALRANVAAVAGGGGSFAGTITRTEISGNSVVATVSGARGGGLETTAATTIAASTISGNTLSGPGFRAGAAVAGSYATTTIRGSTVTGNTGGASLTGVVALHGSAVAGGGAAACNGSITSAGWNVVADTSCGVAQVGDLQGAALLLGALGANGGPTATHVPGPGSPLLGRIPLGTAGLCEGTDQRGVVRPQGGACEVGSVET